jgi:hypothetical protein
MKRRRVLAAASGLAVTAVAGCGAISGGTSCSTPSESVEDAFPPNGTYERVYGPENVGTASPAVEVIVLSAKSI